MSAPGVLIHLRLEGSPRVIVDCVSESEEVRLADWLQANPRYAELIEKAVELERENRAA